MHAVNQKNIQIPVNGISLPGILTLVSNPKGIIIFSHGSGSSRLSPRNTFVANELNNNGFATLLFDLLTVEEDAIYENRFNIDLLTDRLVIITRWIQHQEETSKLPIGYFGASTGAASALKATALLGTDIRAVVSRGGRPDLVLDAELNNVRSPVLLIIGSLDHTVINLNQKAFRAINGIKKIEIIPGANHLFEAPGKLKEVTKHATYWFTNYVPKE
ncbi:Dienelactone hydrolase [Zhouia amylolytica]|uniref:Dienelactone hydrolase n=1 Tax=Zhouia amylolytica TaxID=376730 RepID=A0A1I6V4N1_9FLAO|nr:alpha/beta family hydrolase [Zhouia amylolytica]MCQ0110039.1 dienelactone hydrolase family protein [Zhouia amylolytica]SFT08556.1 Dienelactone hydrolase [Zhouia amylolytica]